MRKEQRKSGTTGRKEERKKKARSGCDGCLLACVCLFAGVASTAVIQIRYHSSTLDCSLSHFIFQYNSSLSDLLIYDDVIHENDVISSLHAHIKLLIFTDSANCVFCYIQKD